MYENNRSITLTPVSGVVRQNRFVSVVTDAEVDETLSGADAVGIALEASADTVQTKIPVLLLDGGKAEVEAGAAVTAGVRVMSDATGRCITATGATARVLGIAVTAASAAGETISIIARPAAGEFVA